MRINRIDHLALAVDSIDAALPFFTEVLGLQVTNTDVEEGQGVVVAFLPVGDSEIELIEPVHDDSGVARFLRGRGPGMHHFCLEVDDMDAALERLKTHEVRLIDEQPYIGTGGRRIVFIHPKAAHGVLVELYEKLPEGNGNGHGWRHSATARRMFKPVMTRPSPRRTRLSTGRTSSRPAKVIPRPSA